MDQKPTELGQTGKWVIVGIGAAVAVAILWAGLSMAGAIDQTDARLDAQEAAPYNCQEYLISGTEDVTRQMMRDPDSFEFVSGHKAPYGNGQMLVTVDYRSKNGFGGYDDGESQALFDAQTCQLVKALRVQ